MDAHVAPPPTVTTADDGERLARRVRRAGLWASILSALILTAILILNYVLYPRGLVDIGTLNLLIQVAALVTPVLGAIGALATYFGWWRILRRRRLKLKEVVTDQLRDQALDIPGRLAANIGRGFSILTLTGSSLFGVATAAGVTYHQQAYSLYTHTESNCSWGTGRPAVCQYQITNDSRSNVTFVWHATTSPGGVSITPDSGSIAPGETSPVITMTDPFLCPVTIRFVDSEHNLEVDSVFNSPCQ
jgi:hypothetical protein